MVGLRPKRLVLPDIYVSVPTLRHCLNLNSGEKEIRNIHRASPCSP